MSLKGIRAALVSVGGNPAPIIFTLEKHAPEYVWYFCSPDSRKVADEIHALLPWHPNRDLIEVERFEELGPCYRGLRETLPGLLKKWRVDPADVLVDYTGGTKTMSAALVLAAMEVCDHFSYVGGEQRQKAGLGITVDGKERIFYEQNPWSDLAVREVERARDLWEGCQYETVAELLRAVAPRVSRRLFFESMAEVAKCMAARHRLDFTDAEKQLRRVRGQIRSLCEGREGAALISFVERAHEICSECKSDLANTTLLRELLDNALRTAGQTRFEDAAARLYRAMEMQGQLWLAETTQNAFQNGRLQPGHSIPGALQGSLLIEPDGRGEVKLSMEQAYLALHRLGDERASRVAADLALENRSRWRRATEKRNSSILGHGVKAVGQDGFKVMREIASEFLGFELETAANPIPALESRWFDS